ncbi:MAG: GGDEF domain-containing protein [Deltaproteobacteria bacterium]|nr:GGDEF domain-containing protein [Deltaproteobacteria bacterium]
MVSEHDVPAHLSKIFLEHPEKIADYLLTSGRLAVILLDRQGTILDCNPFFLENIDLTEKPVGQSIDAFLSGGLPIDKDLDRGDCRPIRLTLALHHSLERSLSGHVIEVGNRYLIFAHNVRLTDHELFATLSKLTDELTDLTRQLNKKNRELESANITITKLMNTDPLTELTNRRKLKEMIDKEMSRARRHGRPLSALMTDIDHFKSINDTYGHDAGDRVLVQVANILRMMCRKEDITARFGGEEFVVILPETPVATAVECAERIRKSIQSTAYPGIDRQITASFGVTLFLADDTEESLIKRADTALYEAKQSGRNRVVLK